MWPFTWLRYVTKGIKTHSAHVNQYSRVSNPCYFKPLTASLNWFNSKAILNEPSEAQGQVPQTTKQNRVHQHNPHFNCWGPWSGCGGRLRLGGHMWLRLWSARECRTTNGVRVILIFTWCARLPAQSRQRPTWTGLPAFDRRRFHQITSGNATSLSFTPVK